ncbi:Oxysterol-binding protein- protein 8, partial [Parelaphostrongylus tenuis]
MKSYSETEAEKHFAVLDEQDVEPDEVVVSDASDSGEIKESPWVESEPEVFITSENSQTEEVGDENKSLIWTLLKQIRPGMDLSKVILPTFILEPRSFLEKLADYYYHADLLAEASLEPDPYNRIVKVVKFYLSGFYKKPKGLKKPYNPILGETFRCRWAHPDGSYTYYIAEQVSHHPPVSSLYVTNRKAGFNVAGTILAKSKYYGNSLSAIMNGTLTISLLDRGEKYVVTLPYASCKGIMIGTMTMELGGQ